MKLFVKFPLLSIVILCGLAEAQYNGVHQSQEETGRAEQMIREQSPEVPQNPGPQSDNGVIVDIQDDKILFYQPLSEDGERKEMHGSIQINGNPEKPELDIKVEEHDQGQVNAVNKKINFDEYDGAFNIKVRRVEGDQEIQERSVYVDNNTHEVVNESCTNATTDSGDCVGQEESRHKINPPRIPASVSQEQMNSVLGQTQPIPQE